MSCIIAEIKCVPKCACCGKPLELADLVHWGDYCEYCYSNLKKLRKESERNAGKDEKKG